MVQDNAQEKDQSMEEILQSIKRIIAEEGDEDSTDANVPGSSILEIDDLSTDSVGSVLDLTEAVDDGVAPMPPRQEAEESPQRDVLADIDSLLSEETVRSSSAALKALTEAHAPARARDISRANPGFRSGNTVEELVLEALRPMLKDWLDQHLAGIVSELVSREIKKLSS